MLEAGTWPGVGGCGGLAAVGCLIPRPLAWAARTRPSGSVGFDVAHGALRAMLVLGDGSRFAGDVALGVALGEVLLGNEHAARCAATVCERGSVV